MTMKQYSKPLLLLVLATALITACSTGAPKQTELMKDFGVEEVTTRELEVIVYGFAVHCAGSVELAAQEIQEGTDSAEIQQNAILWKMNAVPVIYRSAFNPDPLGSLSSVWAFCIQMRQFLTTGAGSDLFGKWQQVAVEASTELEADAEQLEESFLAESDFALFRDGMEKYASNHPIENLLFVRRGDSAKFLKSTAGSSAGGLAAAASMSEEIQSLSNRMSILTVSVPKQVQWHTELMLAQAPELVAEQRDSVMAIMQEESQNMLTPLMEFLSTERQQITADMERERSAVLSAIASERIAVLQTLVEERNIILKTIADERNLTLEQLNVLTLSSIEHMIGKTSDLSNQTVDHVFWRAIQLLFLPFVVLMVMCVIVLLMIRNAIRRHLDMLESERPRSHSGSID